MSKIPETDALFDVPGTASAPGTLTVDLEAIVANWRHLRGLAAPAVCAAVAKADAYGLGAEPVSAALHDAGCRDFFVAYSDEGAAIRPHARDAAIYVLNGPRAGRPELFRSAALIPVLGSLDDIGFWRRMGGGPCALHFDTGINRLGLGPDELETLLGGPEGLAGLDVRLLMSHLACADVPAHPMNVAQRDAFRRLLDRLPGIPASLANSAGVLCGPDYHFDLVRPGCALYGINPLEGTPNPMRPVVHVKVPVLQVRRTDAPMTVGYGAMHRVTSPGRIATVAVGYADGYRRALGGKATAMVGGCEVPVVGRVSMDLMTIDVSAVPESAVYPGAEVTLLGERPDADRLAAAAGTIGYEILTGLGRRFRRRYVGP